LTTLFFQKFPDAFIVRLWNKDIGGVSAGIDDAWRAFFFGVQSVLLLWSNSILIAASF
jgi:hypothetical protein